MASRPFHLIRVLLWVALLASCQPRPESPQARYDIETLQSDAKSTATPAPTTRSVPPTSTVEPTSASPKPDVETSSAWCSSPEDLPEGFLVIGYLPEYQKANPMWGKCLTDLIYFSIEPTDDGGIDTSRVYQSTLRVLREMKAEYGTRLLISVGGYGRSENFRWAATDDSLRFRFTNALVKFARSNGFDGVDFDWEFPAEQAETQGYVRMISSVKEAGLITSVTLYPSGNLMLNPYLIADRVQVMSYNRGPRHSTYLQAVEDLGLVHQSGVPRKKIILGLPFYGRQTVEPFKYFTYSKIVDTYDPSPDQDEIDDIYFNGADTIRQKTCYAFENGFAGVMAWELGQDTTTENSLLRTIYWSLTTGCD